MPYFTTVPFAFDNLADIEGFAKMGIFLEMSMDTNLTTNFSFYSLSSQVSQVSQ